MPDASVRDLKLIQYLNEAYGTEKQLETALEAHIAMTTRASYRKRLQQHLTETRRHARDVERRVKQLGGKAETLSLPGPQAATEAAQTVQTVVGKAAAAAQGPVHLLRGTSEQEKLLKNAKTEYASEAQEIGTYTAIEALADSVGDRETAQLARGILREERRMANFLERLIPTLTKAVATSEIPASERNGGRRRRRRAGSRRASSTRSGGRSRTASGSRSRSRGAKAQARSRRRSTSRSGSARRAGR